MINTNQLLLRILRYTLVEIALKRFWAKFLINTSQGIVLITCLYTIGSFTPHSSHIVVNIRFRYIFGSITANSICCQHTIQSIIGVGRHIAVCIGYSQCITIQIIGCCTRVIACAVSRSYQMPPRIIFIIRGHVVGIVCTAQTGVHLRLDTGVVVKVLGDILFRRSCSAECYLCQQALCIVLIFSYTILYCIRILLLNSLLCQRYITILVILIFRHGVVDRTI